MTGHIRRFFDSVAPDYDSAVPMFATFGRRLVELAAIESGETFVDLGCGRGAALLAAADSAPDATGIGADLSEAMVREASASLSARGAAPRLVRSDIQRLGLRSRHADVALLGFALSFASSPDKALNEALRVVRPGGRVLISFFPGPFGWPWMPELVRSTLPPPHLDANSSSRVLSIAGRMSSAGFEMIGHHRDVHSFVFRDVNAVLAWLLSTAVRHNLDAATDDERIAFRAALATALADHRDSEGRYVLRQEMAVVTGRCPDERGPSSATAALGPTRYRQGARAGGPAEGSGAARPDRNRPGRAGSLPP